MNNYSLTEYSAPFPYFGGGVNRNHKHCTKLLKQGYVHNNLIHRASPWYKTIWNPVNSPYTLKLKKMGYKVPSRKEIGTCYINVHGIQSKADPNFPIALVVYSPRTFEKYFQTVEQAMPHLPRSGDWQVINLITGEIYVEPRHSH
jgi:hypothetical protein